MELAEAVCSPSDTWDQCVAKVDPGTMGQYFGNQVHLVWNMISAFFHSDVIVICTTLLVIVYGWKLLTWLLGMDAKALGLVAVGSVVAGTARNKRLRIDATQRPQDGEQPAFAEDCRPGGREWPWRRWRRRLRSLPDR